jgi:hypothetical protein
MPIKEITTHKITIIKIIVRKNKIIKRIDFLLKSKSDFSTTHLNINENIAPMSAEKSIKKDSK